MTEQPPPFRETFEPSPAQLFLRQALGGNVADVRVPTLLLGAAVLLAVVAAWWRRRRERAGSGRSTAEAGNE